MDSAASTLGSGRSPDMIRDVIRYGDERLLAENVEADALAADFTALLGDMIETCHAAPGIGLAAPQIAVPLRVIIVDLSVGEEPGQLIKLINPEFVLRQGEQRHDEGCLSVPGFGGSPVRPARVVVKGLDPDGKERTYEGTELLARAFCHEIDHLNGVLFLQHLSMLKRDLIKRKIKKLRKEGEW